tara:strand:- start:9270 stop:10388 length:1119 start_codon:yes stop_codon:yes gene_type:complete
MTTPRYIISFLLIMIIFSCTEKFYLDVDENVEILVVDGKITDNGSPCEVRLFRTVSFTDDFSVKPEKDAIVALHDDLGHNEILTEYEAGVYRSSSNEITGTLGVSYWIEIQTLSGDKYESTPEIMHSPFEITSIYGDELEAIMSDNSKEAGVGIYFDAKNNENTESYLRWEYRESYEWHTPFNVETKLTENPQNVCYPVTNYPLINIYDASDFATKEIDHLLTSTILQHEVKLEHQYLIDINLYSVSHESYIFWKNMKAIHQTNGNLYDILPANIKGNINSCDNTNKVLGYFEVSSVRTKKGIFSKDEFSIDFSDFPKECETFIIVGPRPDPMKYQIVKIIPRQNITAYEVRKRHCYECNIKYPINKPIFWP